MELSPEEAERFGPRNRLMYKLLHATKTREATDARDRLHGLLGLACDLDDGRTLLPDDNSNLADVQKQFYIHFFNQGSGYDI